MSNSIADNHLRVTVTKKTKYTVFIESIKEGYYIKDVQYEKINNNGEHLFKVFLESGKGHQTDTLHFARTSESNDFLFNYFINAGLDGFGTEPDGQLKIHFEEADEVPA